MFFPYYPYSSLIPSNTLTYFHEKRISIYLYSLAWMPSRLAWALCQYGRKKKKGIGLSSYGKSNIICIILPENELGHGIYI